MGTVRISYLAVYCTRVLALARANILSSFPRRYSRPSLSLSGWNVSIA